MNSETSEAIKPKVTAVELAKVLSCGKATIYKMAAEGQIPCIRIGSTGVRFDVDAVLAALGGRAK